MVLLALVQARLLALYLGTTLRATRDDDAVATNRAVLGDDRTDAPCACFDTTGGAWCQNPDAAFAQRIRYRRRGFLRFGAAIAWRVQATFECLRRARQQTGDGLGIDFAGIECIAASQRSCLL